MKTVTTAKDASTTSWNFPGGAFIWLISIHETLLFYMAIATFKYQESQQILLFRQEKASLDISWGVIYTLILLTSSWCVAEVHLKYKNNKKNQASVYHFMALALGLLFLIFKLFDFTQKLKQGKVFGDDYFWTLYWVINGFHFLHIFIGFGLLAYLFFKLKAEFNIENLELFESVGIFWHTCDILWILIFSTFYMGG
jgi:nitric oxide reductase NorE protein